MSEYPTEFPDDDYDEDYYGVDAIIDEVFESIPDGCRRCPYLKSMVALLLCFESSTGGPGPAIDEARKHCTGYEGVSDNPGVEPIETAAGPALLFGFDSSSDPNCPLIRYLHNQVL